MIPLASPHVRIGEFVPLLLRLRAADRLTRLVAHPELGRVVRAAADEVLGLDALAGVLGWRAQPEAPFGDVEPEEILAVVREAMAEAEAPLHLRARGKIVLERTGQTPRGSDCAGFGSMEAMLQAAGGFPRQEGPGGGYALRPEWLAMPATPPAEPSSSP